MKPRSKQTRAGSYQRGDLVAEILRCLGAEEKGDEHSAFRVTAIVERFNPEGREERNRIWKILKYLETRERIRIEIVDGERVLTLTRGGRSALSSLTIDDLSIERPRDWDEKWRVVMFDIPMSTSRSRIPFRQKLQDLGFEMYQKSVFVYPFECREEVNLVAQHFGVQQYIRYLVVEEMSDMHELIRKFDLR